MNRDNVHTEVLEDLFNRVFQLFPLSVIVTSLLHEVHNRYEMFGLVENVGLFFNPPDYYFKIFIFII